MLYNKASTTATKNFFLFSPTLALLSVFLTLLLFLSSSDDEDEEEDEEEEEEDVLDFSLVFFLDFLTWPSSSLQSARDTHF